MRYIIVKRKKHYYLYDTWPCDLLDLLDGDSKFIVYKDNKVYNYYSYKEIVDYYCDIGAIYHHEKGRVYLGKLVFESNNIEEIAKKYAELEVNL